MTVPSFLRQSIRLRMLRASEGPLVREISSSSTSRSRRQVLVELTGDVKGLGQTFERMSINPGRARNELVPNGSARMIPWKRRSERTQLLGATRTHTPVRPGIASAESVKNSLRETQPTQTPSAILETLHSLPPLLSFLRRTTAPGADTIHGSLTLSDIGARLENDFGLRNQDVDVSWTGHLSTDERLRRLGHFDCIVRVRGHGQEAAPLGIQIERLAE